MKRLGLNEDPLLVLVRLRARVRSGQRHTSGAGQAGSRILTSSQYWSWVEVWEPVLMVAEVIAFVVMSSKWSVGMIQ